MDQNNDRAFAKVKVTANGPVWMEKEVPPPLDFEKAEVMLPLLGSFKYDLLYHGLSRNNLNLSYREYLNDFARPAFFQDVQYDIETTPTVVTFRSVRIEK